MLRVRKPCRTYPSERPFPTNQFAVAPQNGVRAKDQRGLDLRAEIAGRPPHLEYKDCQKRFLQAREALWLARLVLQHASLLPQQQNLDLLLIACPLTDREQIIKQENR
jgi:hypothetical protein